MRFIYDLSEIGNADLTEVGGKAASLGELIQAGLRVPPGFCVGTEAYLQHLRDNQLPRTIGEILQGLDYESLEDLEQRATQIRGLIEAAPIPEPVAAAIAQAYHQLDDEAVVAVRSSATAEDLPDASFAGQQDTSLNVRGTASITDTVRKCWASLWNTRAVAYRERHGFDHEKTGIAVVVQRMAPADVSGVMFTVNPVTADFDEVVINASWGIGEAIVSGGVDPDEYILDKTDLRVIRTHVGRKEQMILPSSNSEGTLTQAVPEALRGETCLSVDQQRELAAFARRVESFYGFPQDVEWTYGGGELHVLQSRPVTAIDIEFSEDLERWNRKKGGVSQDTVWRRQDDDPTGPCSPMFYTHEQDFMDWVFNDHMNRLYGFERLLNVRMHRYYKGRVYLNCEYWKEFVQYYFPKFARSEAVLRVVPKRDREALRTAPFRWKARLVGYIRQGLFNRDHGFRSAYRAFNRDLPEMLARHRRSHQIDVTTASVEELKDYWKEQDELFRWHGDATAFGLIDHFYLLSLVIPRLLHDWCDDQDGSKLGALSSGLGQTKTGEQNVELWRLSRIVRRTPVLLELFTTNTPDVINAGLSDTVEGREFLREIAGFLQEWGHRGAAERDCMYPRWGDRPELLMSAIKSLLALGDTEDPGKNEEHLRIRRERVTEECFAALEAKRFAFLKRPIFRFLLRWYQRYLVHRDDQRYDADLCFWGKRRAFVGFARHLMGRGFLRNRDEVWFLGKEEVFDCLDGNMTPEEVRTRITARRRVFEKYAHQPPGLFLQGNVDFEDEAASEGISDPHVLAGVAASGGQIRATARVCKTLEETSRIRRGDILVAVGTDPAWSAVFPLLAGVVAETGGVLAHATVLSREYGLPCVTNVSRATELIEDGETIALDGTRGRIRLVDREPSRAAASDGEL